MDREEGYSLPHRCCRIHSGRSWVGGGRNNADTRAFEMPFETSRLCRLPQGPAPRSLVWEEVWAVAGGPSINAMGKIASLGNKKAGEEWAGKTSSCGAS